MRQVFLTNDNNASMTAEALPPTRGAVRRLIATACSTAPWRATAFMLLSFIFGLTYFVALVTAIAVGVGTLIIWIGIPILVMTMVAWRVAANFERWRVRRLLGTDIPTPYRASPEGGLVRRLRTQISEPAAWRDLLYLLLMFPVGIAELVVVVVGFSLTIGLFVTPTAGGGISIGGTHFNSQPASIALGLLAIPVLVLVLNLFVLVGRWHAAGARLLLGPAVSPGLAPDLGTAREKMKEAEPEAAPSPVEERDPVRGIDPTDVADRGLHAAVSALAARSPVPVTVRVDVAEGLPPAVESVAYLVVAEALTNVAKHSHAQSAAVIIERHRKSIVVAISDDGTGGADPAKGTSLRGLSDRVAAMDGRLEVTGDLGTTVRAELPYRS
jgi:Putative sensor